MPQGVGETHVGLVSDGMTYEVVYRWVSCFEIGCRHSGWKVALVWDGCMLNC